MSIAHVKTIRINIASTIHAVPMSFGFWPETCLVGPLQRLWHASSLLTTLVGFMSNFCSQFSINSHSSCNLKTCWNSFSVFGRTTCSTPKFDFREIAGHSALRSYLLFFQQDLLLFADIFYLLTNFWQLFKWGKKKRARTHTHKISLSLSLSLSLFSVAKYLILQDFFRKKKKKEKKLSKVRSCTRSTASMETNRRNPITSAKKNPWLLTNFFVKQRQSLRLSCCECAN
jgi:hypothetical protein